MSNLSIHDRINIRALAAEFPKIGKQQFLERFRRLKIGQTGQAAANFDVSSKLTKDQLVLIVSYDSYLDFVHYGVGKGLSLEDKAISKLVGFKRKPKVWKKGVAHMRYRLGELYGELVSKDMAKYVADQIAQANGKPLMLFERNFK